MAIIRHEKRRLDYLEPNFTITDVELTFELDLTATVVTAVSRVKRLCDNKELPLVLDGDSLTLLDVKINGKNCDFVEDDSSLTIACVPDEFTLTVKTRINPKENSALMGLYVSDGKFCTQNEPEGFRRITYFIDRPDVLARYTTNIIAPQDAYPYMLSNGNLEKDVVANGKRTVTWVDPFPKPSYLFALVAGDFDELRREFITKSGKHVDVYLYVDKGQAHCGEVAIESILKSMAWDEKRFDLEYDLNRFNVVAVDFFNAGAMENKSLNIFNSKYVLVDEASATDTDFENVLSVIGHEYFHNWTGDRVTCRDWFQLSLKEGLTVFRDQEFSSDLCCRAIERIKAVNVIKGAQFTEDAGPMAHPIRPDYVMEMNNFYSVTVYDKGAEVIRMIHTILGEDNFQKGMKLYFKRHDGCAVTCEDFVSAMEDASGIDLTQFRNWYSQAGTPKVSGSMSYDSEKKTAVFTFNQTTPPTPGQITKKPFVIPMSMALYTMDGRKIPLVRNGVEVSPVQILAEEHNVLVFENVPEKPVPALLQNFSAPVKVEYPYGEGELLTLIKYAEDPLVRYESLQNVINSYVVLNTVNAQRKLPFGHSELVIQSFRYILEESGLDNRFMAYILRIPPVGTLMELFNVIDIDAIVAARKELIKTLSDSLFDIWQAVFQKLYAELLKRQSAGIKYECTEEQIGSRDLTRTALRFYVKGLVMRGEAAKAGEIVMEYYQNADNMTDVLIAMNTAVGENLAVENDILSDFENKWQHNPLVFDNYFRAVATAPFPETLSRVKELMQHKCFDLANPNRVRALIGAFAAANPECFNCIDGSGYEFMTEIVEKLNETNPHVAARIMTPMLNLNRLDNKRKSMITQCFNRLLKLPKLSDSIFEIIDKALKQSS